MSAKNEFLKTWARASETLKAPVPMAKRSARRTGAPATEAAPPPAPQAERSAAPALVPFADMDYWYLTTPMRWQTPAPASREVVVPQGFTTDFASVPSSFWSWMPPVGRYGLPAIVHDWLYWEQTGGRREADEIFHSALAELGVSSWRRFILYRSVRWFGGSYWDDNATAKARGEGRILKQYPDDARITWADWKKRPGVFV
ncbi:MAG: DUF1353 domain-containing protein [Hyphomicrobium sp.]